MSGKLYSASPTARHATIYLPDTAPFVPSFAKQNGENDSMQRIKFIDRMAQGKLTRREMLAQAGRLWCRPDGPAEARPGTGRTADLPRMGRLRRGGLLQVLRHQARRRAELLDLRGRRRCAGQGARGLQGRCHAPLQLFGRALRQCGARERHRPRQAVELERPLPRAPGRRWRACRTARSSWPRRTGATRPSPTAPT